MSEPEKPSYRQAPTALCVMCGSRVPLFRPWYSRRLRGRPHLLRDQFTTCVETRTYGGAA